jgi:hypothetical protein
MVRRAFTVALLGLAVAAVPAQAQPRLTMHRAKAITHSIGRDDIALGGIEGFRITRCKRVTRTYVWCELDEWGNVAQPGMPEGEGMYYVDMYLRYGAVHAITPLASNWY